jgi:aminopeptidase N
LEHDQGAIDGKQLTIMQTDRAALDRVWPQQFEIMSAASVKASRAAVFSRAGVTTIDEREFAADAPLIFNADGAGYGLFPADPSVIAHWERLSKVEKGALLINLYELLLEGTHVTPDDHAAWLMEVISLEEDQLLLSLAISEVERIFWTLLSSESRASLGVRLEDLFWQSMQAQTEPSRRKVFFEAFAGVALTEDAIQKLYGVWDGSFKIEGLPLSENDHIDLAQSLAIRLPGQASDILAAQNANTLNSDNKRRLQFLAPSLSSNKIERDRFVASLTDESMREIESWVLDALANIHHPLRVGVSEQYIRSSLELLEKIQATGDIFFPKRWLDVTLRNYSSATAVHTIETFLNERPDYNRQLNMKILQSADSVRRANRLVDADRAQSVGDQ